MHQKQDEPVLFQHGDSFVSFRQRKSQGISVKGNDQSNIGVDISHEKDNTENIANPYDEFVETPEHADVFKLEETKECVNNNNDDDGTGGELQSFAKHSLNTPEMISDVDIR